MNYLARLIAVLSVACVSGCSAAEQSDSVYRGEYFYNFEYKYLDPEGLDEEWCIDGDMAKAELPAVEPTGPWGFTDVVVRGKLGPKGKYGNLGVCERVLTVTELLEASNMRRADRAAP
uniref:Lipoprotein n=1 Tax=Luteimonas lutimaris TaxID=698645 RepID=A0ABP7MQR5_9GAMM